MNIESLNYLIKASEKAPVIFRETVYWAKYRDELIEEVRKMDINDLRSGKHPRFASFGFNEFFPKRNFVDRLKDVVKLAWHYLFLNKPYFAPQLAPYSLTTHDVQEMAYRHCEMKGALTRSKSIHTIEANRFGNPSDFFEMEGRTYTMAFLEYYLRYCFANQHIGFTGEEIIVELGSGSGHQVEVLKKLYPGQTILCFDLPVQLFLCQQYLGKVLGQDQIVPVEETLEWKDLSKVKRGKVHFFANWQFDRLKNFSFDLFWNAASFGEMEPGIVKNYLDSVIGNCRYIYLLQSRRGKGRVEEKIKFEDYKDWLHNYSLIQEEDAYQAHKRLQEESNYFQAVWRINVS